MAGTLTFVPKSPALQAPQPARDLPGRGDGLQAARYLLLPGVHPPRPDRALQHIDAAALPSPPHSSAWSQDMVLLKGVMMPQHACWSSSELPSPQPHHGLRHCQECMLVADRLRPGHTFSLMTTRAVLWGTATQSPAWPVMGSDAMRATRVPTAP